MLRKSILLSFASVAATVLVATPAAAQQRPSEDGQPSAPCRVSANDQGGACGSGLGRVNRQRGARSAHAILFFGGSSARLMGDRPGVTAGAERAPQPPAFTLPLRPQ